MTQLLGAPGWRDHTSKFSVSLAEQATPGISFTYNHLTVGSGDQVSVTKWIEYYYAGTKDA
jgi:hypothetical protein